MKGRKSDLSLIIH